jgi:peptide/nickel transport system substrate-binding protein
VALASCAIHTATVAPVTETATMTKVAARTETPTRTQTPAITLTPTMAIHPLWSKGLRQAIAAAIDRQDIMERVFEGRDTPAYHMIPPGYPYYTEPFLDKYGKRDLELSRRLLTGLGYTENNPFTFDLWYPPDHFGTSTADMMQVIKGQLEETGLMKVNLQSQSWPEYVDSFLSGKAPLFLHNWFPDFVDPDNWLTPFASCAASPGQGANYCNPEMDALLHKGATTLDPQERAEAYQRAGELYAEDIPTIPIYWEPEFIVARQGVDGVAIGPPFEFNYKLLRFSAGATPASGRADTIIIGTSDEVNSLDPGDAYAIHDWEIIKNTGVPLLKYRPGTVELTPGAAIDLPTVSEDGKTYSYTLRDGIKFADGTPLTAQDYVRSWHRITTLNGQVSNLMQAYIDSMEAPDDKTVIYHLKDAYAFFPAITATSPFVPANPNIFPDDQIVQFPEKLDGIGPYRMVSYTLDEQMVLEANPNYFGDDKPIIKNVIVRYFSGPTMMSEAIQQGDIDIAWRNLDAAQTSPLQSLPGLVVTKIDSPDLRFLVFNQAFMIGGSQP